MGTLFSTVHYTLHKMKFLPVILFVFLVIAGYHASSVDSLKDGELAKTAVKAMDVCGKQCKKINKAFKKKFEKHCPEQVCKDEATKDKIFKQFDNQIEKAFKKFKCEEPCVKSFDGEKEHDHDHEHEE